MDSWFYKLGKAARPAAQKGKWIWQSLTGVEAEAIQAEYDAGRELAVKFQREADIDTDSEVVNLFNDVGGRLARGVMNKQRRFTFCAVRLPEPNAFALPGGFVFVTRSLLELCEWRARVGEVAFILSHEMAHVMRGHAMQRMVNSSLINAAARVTPVGGWMGRLLVQVGSQFLQSAYSQDQELEADALAIRLVAAAGYDPRAAIRMLNRLKGLSTSACQGEVDLGSYFSSHPLFDVRIENLDRLIKA